MKTVPSDVIYSELRALGFDCDGPRDTQYACPSPAWLPKFGAYCKAGQPAQFPDEGEGEGNDCDDVVVWTENEARKAAAKNPEARKHGRAIVPCKIIIPLIATEHENDDDPPLNNLNGIPASTHETTIIRCDDDRWYFLEPQTGLYCDAAQALRAGRCIPVSADP